MNTEIEHVYDGYQWEEDGLLFTVMIEEDDEEYLPWNKEDGWGIVSGWERREKGPGERIVAEDRGMKVFYDVQRTMEKAKKEGWDYQASGNGTVGEKAARAVEANCERVRGLYAGNWGYVLVGVRARDIETGGLKFDESDWIGQIESDYKEGIVLYVKELASALLGK
jgi:hypothetical protein